MTFATPKEAAEALIQAAANYDLPTLTKILGPDGEDLVSTKDPVQDKNSATSFAAKAREKNSVVIDPKNSKLAILSIGDEDWPTPIPIVEKKGKWYFDSKAGREELLLRRIGRNELDAINICRGYVEAQKTYAEQVHGLLEGGSDLLIIETIFDTLNAKAAIVAIESVFAERGARVPVMISVTFADKSGRNLSGQTVDAFWTSVRHANPIAVGANCGLGPEETRPYLVELARIADTYTSCHPNAGMPNALGGYFSGSG